MIYKHMKRQDFFTVLLPGNNRHFKNRKQDLKRVRDA